MKSHLGMVTATQCKEEDLKVDQRHGYAYTMHAAAGYTLFQLTTVVAWYTLVTVSAIPTIVTSRNGFKFGSTCTRYIQPLND